MKELLIQLVKALPRAIVTLPPPKTGRQTFSSLAEAQLYLGQFSLSPVISDSFIDVDGIGYKQVGVIWQKGPRRFEVELMDVDKVNRQDVLDKKATLFGAR